MRDSINDALKDRIIAEFESFVDELLTYPNKELLEKFIKILIEKLKEEVN